MYPMYPIHPGKVYVFLTLRHSDISSSSCVDSFACRIYLRVIFFTREQVTFIWNSVGCFCAVLLHAFYFAGNVKLNLVKKTTLSKKWARKTCTNWEVFLFSMCCVILRLITRTSAYIHFTHHHACAIICLEKLGHIIQFQS